MSFSQFFNSILNLCYSFFSEGGYVVNWLFSPISGLGLAPIMLFSMSGLLVYLTFAVAKWFIS